MKRLFKVPFTVQGECYVWADNLDDAISEADFAPATDLVESNYSHAEVEIDEDNVEEVKGMPASARAI